MRHSMPLARVLAWLFITGLFMVTVQAQVITRATAQVQTQTTMTTSDWVDIPGGDWHGSTSWVAADGKGHILVMVRSAPHFRLFSRDGTLLRTWGEEGLYRNAHSVTFDQAGNIWATDAARHVIDKYSIEGELLMSLGQLDEAGDNQSRRVFNQPNHVAVAGNGDIYVSDGYGNARIVVFNSAGVFQRIISGEQGMADGQLALPHGVAIDSRGRILVNDSDNKRISVFDAAGNFLEAWPFPSRGGIVVMPDDTVYVSDVNAGAVNVIREGELIESIPVDARPHGLAVDSDGTIYVSDARGQLVLRINRQG